jgi:hypothetical protein
MQAELKITRLKHLYRLERVGRCEWCHRRRVLYLVGIWHETRNMRHIRVSGYTEATICNECDSELEVR